MKIGVMFGSPETTTGGNALKFYASVRLDIRRIGTIKKGDEVIGNETKVKVVKNKVAPPLQAGGVRHPVRRRHQPRRRNPRPGRGAPRGGEVGCLVCLQRRKDRTRPRQLARIPARKPRAASSRSRTRCAPSWACRCCRWKKHRHRPKAARPRRRPRPKPAPRRWPSEDGVRGQGRERSTWALTRYPSRAGHCACSRAASTRAPSCSASSRAHENRARRAGQGPGRAGGQGRYQGQASPSYQSVLNNDNASQQSAVSNATGVTGETSVSKLTFDTEMQSMQDSISTMRSEFQHALQTQAAASDQALNTRLNLFQTSMMEAMRECLGAPPQHPAPPSGASTHDGEDADPMVGAND